MVLKNLYRIQAIKSNCNPVASRMLGYGPEELIGDDVHKKIHHSHADGSAYPKTECPMYSTYVDDTDHHIAVEVLWRKDGTQFPVEYMSMPINKDGRVVGAVSALSKPWRGFPVRCFDPDSLLLEILF